MRTEDIRNMAKAYAAVLEKAKNEELKGDQHKIDANGNGKVDAHDFKMLRKKSTKKETATKSTTTVSNNAKTDTDVQTQEAKGDNPPFSGGKPIKAVNKDKYGNVIKDKNRPKHLAKMAMQKQKTEEVDLDEGKYVGGAEHTWPKYIGGINSKQAKAIKNHLTNKGHSFEDHSHLERNKKADTHYISMRTKEGHAELQKAKAKHKVDDSEERRKNLAHTARQRAAQGLPPLRKWKGDKPVDESTLAEAKKLKLSDFKVGMFVQGKGGKVGKITANEPRGDQIVVKWNKGGTAELPIKGLGLYTKPRLQGLVMGEEVELDEAATAQHKPDEKTSDTKEKQLKRSKGEKDFVDQHKAETPEAGDEPKVDAMNFQKFKAMTGKIGKDTSRKADNRKGDNNIVPSGTPIKDPAAPKIREQSEQLDELSIDTLQRYSDKATKDKTKMHSWLRKNMFPSSKDSKYKQNKFYKLLKKNSNRAQGIERAWKKTVDKGAYPDRKPGDYGWKVVSKKDKN